MNHCSRNREKDAKHIRFHTFVEKTMYCLLRNALGTPFGPMPAVRERDPKIYMEKTVSRHLSTTWLRNCDFRLDVC